MCAFSVTKSCLTLCNPMDCSLQGSSVHGIILARILEWVVISSSMVYMCVCMYTYTMKYYSVIRKIEILPFGTGLMDLECIMLRKIHQREKNQYYMVLHLYMDSEKNKNNKTSS